MPPILSPRVIPALANLILTVLIDLRSPINRHRHIRPPPRPLNHDAPYPAARDRRRAGFTGMASSSAVVSFS